MPDRQTVLTQVFKGAKDVHEILTMTEPVSHIIPTPVTVHVVDNTAYTLFLQVPLWCWLRHAGNGKRKTIG